MTQLLDRVTRADSAIPLSLQPICCEILEKCAADKEVLRASQYVMQALEKDFLEELDSCGARSRPLPAPSRQAAALFGKGANDLVDVVEIPKNDWYAFGRIFLKGAGPFLERLLQKLGEFLGVGDFLFEYPPSGSVVLRFPPPAAYLSALAVFGEEGAPRAQPTCAASTLAEVRDLMADGRRPWRLDALPYEVHGHSDQHPYVGALHDLLHLLRLSRIPPEFRPDLLSIFDALQKVPVEAPGRGLIEEIALEGPFDDQMDARTFSPVLLYERLFRQMNALLGRETTEAVRGFAADFYAKLREDFGGHPREKAVLGAFAREIHRKRAPG